MYSDGAARGNPGPAGAGVVIYGEDNKVLKEVAEYLGEMTNNQAEYRALILGLEAATLLDVNEVECFLDSELVVKQATGEYKVKDEGLKPLFARVLGLTNRFQSVSFRHVEREKNKVADKLANQGIDNK